MRRAAVVAMSRYREGYVLRFVEEWAGRASFLYGDGHGELTTDGCDVRTLGMAETEPSGMCFEAQLTSVCASHDIMFFWEVEANGLRFGRLRDTAGSARSRETCRTLWSPLDDGVGQIGWGG